MMMMLLIAVRCYCCCIVCVPACCGPTRDARAREGVGARASAPRSPTVNEVAPGGRARAREP